MPSAMPWQELMRLCIGQAGWRPADFWAATPREVAALFAPPPAGPLNRADFDRLANRYPDGA